MELPFSWEWAALTVIGAGLALLLYGLNIPRRWQLRHLPGPTPLPFVGNLLDVAKKGLHESRNEWTKAYGDVYVWWRGRLPVVVVSQPEDARKVVLKLNDKSFNMPSLSTSKDAKEIQKHSLAFMGKDRAKSVRAAWQPVFHSASLAEYAAPMRKGAERLMARLAEAEKEQTEVNIWRLLGDMTMDVVGTTAFGVDLQTQADTSTAGSGEDPSKSFTAAAQTIFRNGAFSGGPLVLIALSLPFMTPVLGIVSEIMKHLNLLPSSMKEVSLASKLLADKSLALTEAAQSNSMDRSDAPAVGSFLYKFASSKHSLNNYAVASQANVFMLAGYETTANTLATSLYNLAAHPEAMHRAVAEVDAFGSNIPEFKDLSLFPYIEAVVNESLRLYPPVSGTIPRRTEEDMVLCGRRIPAGVDVAVNIYHMHHDAANFADPELFKPERFMKGDPGFEEHHPYAHMPFGGGARVCIGMKFALEEVKLVLISVLQGYHIKLSPGQVPLKLGKGLTLGPANGIYCRVSSRTG
mmetsp:Transcript_11953/g.30216  ORF Transcript_11953/g.30216 Transcript_11953/m.30216 type:complete len:521 (+) Transcript_11953:2-1564(+)